MDKTFSLFEILTVLKIRQSVLDCTFRISSLHEISHRRRLHLFVVRCLELEISLFTAFPKIENVSPNFKMLIRWKTIHKTTLLTTLFEAYLPHENFWHGSCTNGTRSEERGSARIKFSLSTTLANPAESSFHLSPGPFRREQSGNVFRLVTNFSWRAFEFCKSALSIWECAEIPIAIGTIKKKVCQQDISTSLSHLYHFHPSHRRKSRTKVGKAYFEALERI